MFIIAIVFLNPKGTLAQDEKQNIIDVVNNFIKAVEIKNVSAIQQSFTSNNILQTVSWNQDGKYYVKTETLSEFISFLNSTTSTLKEEINIESVTFDNRLASVWAPYKNLVNGTLTHCGTNSFQLVKIDNIWKIHYYIDTRTRFCTLIENDKPASSNNNTAKKSIIFMKKQNGLYFIPCKVNGLDLDFIFDTGATDVTISLTEANYMFKNGLLKTTDIISKTKFTTADGSIANGTNIILKELRVGPFVLNNVNASVVHSLNAPLLLGQTVLSKFGKFSFDYQTKQLEILK